MCRLSSIVLVVILLTTGCDPTISPIKENDLHYSVFGYLDASADTQFVRIEKLRDSLFTDSPANLNIDVRLTNLSTSQQVTMQDSLFRYSQGRAHNYFTTMDIIHNDRYRLEVIGNDGATTSAEVPIPGSYPKPEILEATDNTATLKIPEMERLIAVKAIYYTYLTCLKPPEDCPENPTISQLSFSHLADTNHVYNGGIQAMVRHSENRRKISARYGGQPYKLIRGEIMIASGNPNWPDFLSLDEETAALPNVASNIEGGTGLLGGIVSDTVVVLGGDE